MDITRSGPDSSSSPLCATVVGNREEPSGESTLTRRENTKVRRSGWAVGGNRLS